MSHEKWATLTKVSDRLQAEIIKSALEAQGIPAHIFQEGLTHFAYPVNVGPLSEMEIAVPENRLEEARTWLEDYEDGGIELENLDETD